MTDTEKLPADWAIKRAIQRLPFKNYWSVHEVKTRFKKGCADNTCYIMVIAKVIEEHEQPPVSQELLIWREAQAQYYESKGYDESFCDYYRSGGKDGLIVNDRSTRLAIKLALEGFGKEQVGG